MHSTQCALFSPQHFQNLVVCAFHLNTHTKNGGHLLLIQGFQANNKYHDQDAEIQKVHPYFASFNNVPFSSESFKIPYK